MYGVTPKKDEVRNISEYAFQALFDIITLNFMSLEYSPEELVNKITGTQILPPGKEFTAAPLITTKTGELERWLTTEYDYYRKKNLIIHLNTIFENYLYNFAKLWIEQRPSILDKYTVSFKQVRENNKEEMFDNKLASYIQYQLLRGSYSKVFKNFRKMISVDFSVTDPEIRILDEFYQIRNILVHSNGIIGNKIVSLFPEKKYNKGEQIFLDSNYIRNIEILLRNQISNFDRYLIKNFPDFATKSSSEFEEVGITYFYT